MEGAQWVAVARGQELQHVDEAEEVLDKEELLKHAVAVREAKLKEIRSWHSLNTFAPQLRSAAWNVIDARWVIRWKYTPEGRIVRARICIQGFRDKQQKKKFLTAVGMLGWFGHLKLDTAKHAWGNVMNAAE